MFDVPLLILTLSMKSVIDSDVFDSMSAEDSIVPRTVRGSPGRTAATVSNSEMSRLPDMICVTFPIEENASA